ncbi:MAG: ABC transporter permease, partial [Paramuribaculum sp.]|nr:ABC transporter permease [Paramuribaculum sp.]
YWDKVRTAVSGSVFLLVIVFLGFIGTFWFRTRQRRSEIAIRKVNGATDGNIYCRLFSEGLTILLVAAIIDLPLAYLAIGKLNIGQELNRQMCWPSFALSVLLMAVMILVGVWFPARNAMKIQPSDALHDE